MSHPVPPCRPFIPHSMEDRAYWQRVQSDPATADMVRALLERCDAAPARPPIPLASDYLAARRTNNRGRIDNYWQRDRTTFSALVLRRCLLGIDPNDADDRLLDWLFAFATHPTWVVSAHLPANDLPASGAPQLDLAATEMAGVLAETVEVLRPWIDSVSQTLAASIIREIDQRVLEPFVLDRTGVGWAREEGASHRNNWTGVCAGSILVACESLARQGHPRPDARARALRLLNRFLHEAFTPTGECDEGVSYWHYGVGYACHGLCRLAPEDLAGNIDLDRLRQIASYPGRAHLFATTFYSSNDSTSSSPAQLAHIPWLAEVTGDAFLRHWLAIAPSLYWRDIMGAMRVFDALLDRRPGPTEPPVPQPTRYLEDQQVAITRLASPTGEMIVALSGGNNGERHNHNDIGHFIVAINGQMIIPDLGAPYYTADFFGPRRYTYLSTASRGHCCPVINAQEQRPGADAAATVLQRDWTATGVNFVLDATAAYPPEAALHQWTRALRTDDQQAIIADTFRLASPGRITHVLWFTSKPDATQVNGSLILRASTLQCQLDPAPEGFEIIAVDPAEHRLREFRDGQTLYRVEASYSTTAESLEIRTILRAIQ